MLLVSIALWCILCTCVLGARPVHLRLSWHTTNTTGGVGSYIRAANALRERYDFSFPSYHPQKRQHSVDVPLSLQNSNPSYSFVSIEIGAPPQSFDVMLDTGSADLWVMLSTCATCDPNARKFATALSSSFQALNSNRVSIPYVSGSITGTAAQDAVGMGGFHVLGQPFLAVDQVQSQPVSGAVSGIMGLAFGAISAISANPFWWALVANQQLDSPDLAFRFANTSALGEEAAGTFTLGGTHPQLFVPPIEFWTGKNASFWLIDLIGMRLNGSYIGLTRTLAAIDTGANLIGGPSEDVAKFWGMVPNAQQAGDAHRGFWTFPCSTTLSVSLSFGNRFWAIHPPDMNLGPVLPGSNSCLGTIFDIQLGKVNTSRSGITPDWILGIPFLKNVYTVLRYTNSAPSIGFAELLTAAPVKTTTANPSSTSLPFQATISLPDPQNSGFTMTLNPLSISSVSLVTMAALLSLLAHN